MGSIVAEIADKIAANAEADEIRGGTGADGGGILTLSTSELTVVDGDILGRIDFQAPLETGADAILVGASIYAEADDTFAADNNSTELVFATGASEAAAEKMRITSDGKVGIGTATPVTDLTVEGPITIKEQAAADADTAGYGQIWVDDAANSPLMYTNDAGDDIGITTGSTLNAASLGGAVPAGVTGGAGLTGSTSLGTVATGVWEATDVAVAHGGTGASTAAAAATALGLGTGDYPQFDRVSATGSANSGYWVYNTTTVSGNSLILCRSYYSVSNETKFEVNSAGNVKSRTNSYGSFSDESLKEQITTAGSQWDDIKAIEIKNFKFISESLSDEENPKLLGVIAQQVEQVSPGLVDEGSDNIKSVKYSILYMKAVKALQEAMTRIEVLETKVTALENA